jgi:SAM-dependent methyltransferase
VPRGSAVAPTASDIELESPPCNLCGGDDFRLLASGLCDRLLGLPGDWAIAECEECGLVQTRPRPDRASIRHFYPDDYELALGAPRARKRAKPLAALADLRDAPFRGRYGRQHVRKPSDDRRELLEIGPAGGANLARYVAVGWNVTAVEPSPGLAAIAARRAGIPSDRVVSVPAEEAEFDENRFDLIVMFHVIEHLHDPVGVLGGARRWLSEGGTLEIGCPNYASLERRLFGRFWIGLDVPRHLYHFTPATLSAMLEKVGFEVTSIAPELEYCSTSLSSSAALDALRGLRRPVRASRGLRLAVTPFTAASRALGSKPCMLVTATPA